ncbi:MAG: hypothetical protein ACKOQS_10225, partial [Dolichospermum sp.]
MTTLILLSNSWLRRSLSIKNDTPLLICDGRQDDFILQYKVSSCLIESENIGTEDTKPANNKPAIKIELLRRCLVSFWLNSVISCIY